MVSTVQTAPSSAGALRRPRRLRRPRGPDSRALFGAFILVTTTGASLAFWSATFDTQAVLVAARDVPAGARLTAADVAVAHVRLGDAVYRTVIPASEHSDAIGRQLSQALVAHQLLARAHVTAPGPTTLGPHQLAMTIPVSADSAAGGRLRPGDAVRVLATFVSLAAGPVESESHTAVVLPRATVYDVGYEERTAAVTTAAGGAMVNAGSGGDGRERAERAARITSVTLVVTQDQALDLARARWNGELDVVLLPPGS